MNKIMLVVDGEKIDSMKLVSSLQKMILDPSKETIKVIEGTLNYKERGPIGSNILVDKKTDIFIGQIVDKSYKTFPCIIQRGKKEYWCSGFIDLEQTLSSPEIQKYVLNSCKDEKIKSNPNSLLKYLFKKCGIFDLETLLYDVDSFVARLDTTKDGTALHCFSNGNTVVFYSQDNWMNYYCNSKEVLDYLGLKTYAEKVLRAGSYFYPAGGYGHGYSDPTKEEIENAKFPTIVDKAGSELEQALLSVTDQKSASQIITAFYDMGNNVQEASKNCIRRVYTFKRKNN